MDEIDRKLVALLRADARTPVAVLARKLGVSRGTVQNRIDRMRSRGDIAGFTLEAAPDAEGQRVRAVMAIAVEGERSGAVLKALRGFAEIQAVHMTNGRWDMIAEISAEDLAAFSRVLDEVRLIEGISATETSLLLRTHRM
ncbi:MAG TPA: Lrp/AsnC family transcriptional regulator [Caulobacteraceae bacterium]|nr:Lrp/AsnC family transcriptional regulator [Caulobacteraceae bacterium]